MEWKKIVVLKLLERMLSLIEDHHVLVIHCHGMEGDCGTETTGRMLSMIEDHHVLVIHCHGMEGVCGTETAGRDAVND